MTKDLRISDQAFGEQLIHLPAVGDRVRLVGLDQVQVFATAKERSLLRELARMTARLGSDAPEVKLLAQRLETQKTMNTQIRAEIQRAEIEPLAPKPGAFTIHGRVVDADGIGQEGLTVSAVDHQGSALTFACSDARGYFKLELSIAEEKKAQRVQLFLLVSEQDKTVLFQGEDPHVFVPGGIVYRELVIGNERKEPCPSPPQVSTVIVPALIGLPETNATNALEQAGLTLGRRDTQPSQDRIGEVVAQDPAAGATVLVGTSVDLAIGVTKKVTVPNVVGLELQQAEKAIEERKLSLGSVKRVASKVGVVLEQKPLTGTEAEIKTAVDLVVGVKGPIPKEDIIDWFMRFLRT